ncbi:zinc finger BED domain-containing protein RICESLEEPER 2-like [Cynara cardunculus var. scolymus]|uniref:zinc finger BED domain-containing protein RICESLEEPER 2-like n=1 Tax=Cynara cardunculus var. scolymus TaxID=59895 RepID=UPI000D62C055|nr:zinc finger BED domain-containing protein RICESLEEPER 2-like [Cynara cardunculus var. scolymus]
MTRSRAKGLTIFKPFKEKKGTVIALSDDSDSPIKRLADQASENRSTKVDFTYLNTLADAATQMITPSIPPSITERLQTAEAKKHGTSSLNNHMKACLKNPHAKETKQSILAFQSAKFENSDGALTSWVFNQEVVRKMLAKMIIMDELPFRFVEGRGFKQFVETACPRFKISSRWTVNRDIFSIYFEEKTNLKKLFKSSMQQISLTTDTWTFVQRINYMCVTAHFIDGEWKLNKKAISFVPIHSYKGESISKAIESCLLEWGVKNIFTITVDNASSNDIAVGFMKKKVVNWGGSSTRAEFNSKKIRDCIRWVRGSPSRLKKFRELAELLEVEEKSSLCLDVPTRWNSTYMMLQTAIGYRKVFETYESSDIALHLDLGDSMPSYLDWLQISDFSCIIADMLQYTSKVEEEMGVKMKEKFSKYWGDPDKMNFVIFFGNILDPRDKVEYMQV